LRAGFAFLFLLATAARGQQFQSWNEVDLTASWHKVQFLTPLVARIDPSLPNPQLAAIGVTADLPLPWKLTLTAGYLFADLPQISDHVHLPLAALTVSRRPGRWEIANRNRFERLIGYGANPVRYRNRLLVDRQLGTEERWHLFASDEAIFDLSAGKWSQNRFQCGAGAHLSGRFLLDLYLLHRNSSGAATKTDVFGTNLRIALTRP
jgi:hypothetical protein